MKTAICLSGLPREVNVVWESFRDNLVNQFPNSDLFIYTGSPYLIDREFFETFNIKAYVVEPQFDHVELKTFLNQFKFCHHNHMESAVVQQFYGLKRVNEIRKDYENKFKTKYDIVIRTRPDYIYLRPIKPEFFDLSKINNMHASHAPSMAVEFAIGSSDVMDKYFGIYDWLMSDGQEYLNKGNPRLTDFFDYKYNCDLLMISYLVDFLGLELAKQNLPPDFPSPYDYYRIFSRHKNHLY